MSQILDNALKELNKKYKETIVVKGTTLQETPRIPFSSPRLNYMTYGGIPRGKVTELSGPENGGKTTTAIDLVANAQIIAQQEYTQMLEQLNEEVKELSGKSLTNAQAKLNELYAEGPQKVVYVDAENTFDDAWAVLNGVDTESLYLVRPQAQTAEQVLQIMLDLIQTGRVICMVLDSIPMLVPQQVFEETLEKKLYGGASGPLSQFAARASSIVSKTNTTLIMINQVREDLNNPYNQDKTPGGRALRHLFALRLHIKRGSFLDGHGGEVPERTETPAGQQVMVKITKTKICKPDRRIGYYTLMYGIGVDKVSDLVDVALKHKIITQSGAWYYIMDPQTGEIMEDPEGNVLKFQGKYNLLNYIRDDDVVAEILEELVMNNMDE